MSQTEINKFKWALKSSNKPNNSWNEHSSNGLKCSPNEQKI